MAHFTYVSQGNPMWREYFMYPPLQAPISYTHQMDYGRPMANFYQGAPMKEHMAHTTVYQGAPIREYMAHPMVPVMSPPMGDSFAYRSIPLHVYP
jgi:hypothetical protein